MVIASLTWLSRTTLTWYQDVGNLICRNNKFYRLVELIISTNQINNNLGTAYLKSELPVSVYILVYIVQDVILARNF